MKWIQKSKDKMECSIPEKKAYLFAVLERNREGAWILSCKNLFDLPIMLHAKDQDSVCVEATQMLHNIIFQQIRELQQCANAVGAAL